MTRSTPLRIFAGTAARAWLDPSAKIDALISLLAPRSPDGMRVAVANERAA